VPPDGQIPDSSFNIPHCFKSVWEHDVNERAYQKEVVLHSIPASTDNEPAFLEMNHDNAHDENKYGDDGGRLNVSVSYQQDGAHDVRQFYSPGKRNTKRCETNLIQVCVSKVVDTSVKHTGQAMGKQDKRYCRTEDEGLVDHGCEGGGSTDPAEMQWMAATILIYEFAGRE